MECDEQKCGQLFVDLYRECAVADATEPWPTVRCSVVPFGAGGDTRISFDGIDPVDMTGFALSLFQQMDCRRVEGPPGWEAVETVVTDENRTDVTIKRDRIPEKVGVLRVRLDP